MKKRTAKEKKDDKWAKSFMKKKDRIHEQVKGNERRNEVTAPTRDKNFRHVSLHEDCYFQNCAFVVLRNMVSGAQVLIHT